MTPRNKHLLLNWAFLPCLLVLALNDHYLKAAYPGWLTGKLSDFAGLLIFPLFLAYLFPHRASAMPWLTGLFFIFWKSPLSTPCIDTYNTFAPIGITRTVDYSDLLALAVLPLSSHLIRHIDRYRMFRRPRPGLAAPYLIIPCSLAFMSTSPPLSYRLAHNPPNGDIYIGEYYTVKLPPEQVLEAMRKEGLTPMPDTACHQTPNTCYLIDNVTFPGISDTLQSVRFRLYKEKNNHSTIWIDKVTKRGNFYLSDWKLLKIYTRYYRQMLHHHMVRQLR
ncbi:hypothetical protein Q4E93_20040 [Flavitalea sp. BT771]|uniref:hypothetical protein n=1 Tax=Flavitalea sp. BT771 TaxID=3063329 RepID=UPI0026E1ECFE|nr:hypothetical protein [Flavitalea sp. BT771]MDO6432910.1 hypothetical protein [Flavitalea sp. BT771]MDV6221814.1 hypothetical protein [Flavitalea sp. BT771]